MQLQNVNAATLTFMQALANHIYNTHTSQYQMYRKHPSTKVYQLGTSAMPSQLQTPNALGPSSYQKCPH